MSLSRTLTIILWCNFQLDKEQQKMVAQSAATVEYTDCFSAEGYDPPNGCPGYDTKQSDGEVSVMLKLWVMWKIPLLPSLPGSLWPGVVAHDKCPFYGLYRTKPWFVDFFFLHLNCVFMPREIV